MYVSDANYVIVRALISNTALYVIFCSLLADLNLEIKNNNKQISKHKFCS